MLYALILAYSDIKLIHYFFGTFDKIFETF